MSNTPGLTPKEQKRISVPMRTKVLDGAKGECEHIVSVFSVVDYGGDRILPGFFAKSLTEKLPKGVWCHDWTIPVAKTLEAAECMPGDERLPEDIRDFGGLYVKAQYNLDTQRGRDAFSDVSGGYMDEFSIGFTVEKEAKDPKTGVNNLIEGRLFEWSPVLWGMNPLTRHVSAKAKAPATSYHKGGQSSWNRLRGKGFAEDLPVQMTWGALSRAVDCLWSLCFDAVFGCGEFREMDTTSRAGLLQEAVKDFSQILTQSYLALMTALDDLAESSDSEAEADAREMKVRAALAVLVLLSAEKQEQCLARLTGDGKKLLAQNITARLKARLARGDSALTRARARAALALSSPALIATAARGK